MAAGLSIPTTGDGGSGSSSDRAIASDWLDRPSITSSSRLYPHSRRPREELQLSTRSVLRALLRVRSYSRTPTIDGSVYSIRNPWVLLRRKGIIELTDGTGFPFDGENKETILGLALFAIDNGVRFGNGPGAWGFDSHSGTIETPGGIRLLVDSLDSGIFAETFLQDVHFVEPDLKERVVVEGGAFVGDTALYYAAHGARVFSFEPDPRSYELARRNIALNDQLSSRVTLRNWAIGRDGVVDFPLDPSGSGASSLRVTAKSYHRVRSVSIQTILREFGIERPFLLHLDIKGEEFTVIGDEAVGAFERARIEYSPFLVGGGEDPHETMAHLRQRLRSLGFQDLREFKHNGLRYDLRFHGTLDARKARV